VGYRGCRCGWTASSFVRLAIGAARVACGALVYPYSQEREQLSAPAVPGVAGPCIDRPGIQRPGISAAGTERSCIPDVTDTACACQRAVRARRPWRRGPGRSVLRSRSCWDSATIRRTTYNR